jgi:hypothetical protein
MVQGLMRRPHASQFHPCRHWFDALPIAREQRARARGSKRRGPIGMAEGRRYGVHLRESRPPASILDSKAPTRLRE